MNKLKIMFLILLLTEAAFGTIRYVSKTGSSTPPYTSWETASDSIQKCISICVDGDTVIVANGVYKESLIINPAITLIGSSMDSCIIDGRGLALITISLEDHGYISGIHIIGRGKENMNFKGVLCGDFKNLDVMNCRISNCYDGIYFTKSSGEIKNVIMQEIVSGVFTFCMSDTCKPKLYNSLLVLDAEEGTHAWTSFDGGQPTIENNIMVGKIRDEFSAPSGISTSFRNHKTISVKNNLMSGFVYCIPQQDGTDSGIVANNVMTENLKYRGIIDYPNNILRIRSNILSKGGHAIKTQVQPNVNYNLFWENDKNISSPFSLGSGDIEANPMLVKDTLGYSLKADYHLQKYSPGIDAGDPSILDIDGSRSDIGLFGGPLGQIYTYLDLAPKPPRNLTAQLSEGQILLSWNRNSEADLFRYRVYRDTLPGFIYDTSKIIGVVSDTFFVDNLPDYYRAGTYYYKITAIDSAFNQSPASEEITVVVTGAAEGPPVVTEEYKLLQNYPNPFNPSTVIPYRLKDGGYVKIMVYNLLGELVRVLQNGYQNPGYYEVEFSPTKDERRKGEGILEFETFYRNDVVSGIYLYRIEVIGEGNIPRFMDMKKMMLVK
ncbi:MAG TPA: hypothetical protein PLT92_13405 [Ignavibacteriaceae bacterium]|nr:hypothetical protein [Ignavibacteriaceae bacterium]